MSRGLASPPRLVIRSWGLAAPPVAFLAVFFALPTAALVLRGLTDAATETLPWARIARAAGTTVGLATAGTLLALVLGAPAAWALFRRAWRGSRIVIAALTAPFVLPTLVVASAFTTLLDASSLSEDVVAKTAALIGALAFFNVAVVVRIVGPVWQRLDDSLLGAAATLGASPVRAFLSVRLPELAPALAAAGATVWMFCASSFGLVIVLGGGHIATIDTEIWLQTTQFLNLSAAAVLGLLQLAVVTTALVLVSRLRGASRAQATDTTSRPMPHVRGWSDRLRIAAAVGPALTLMVVPTVSLLMRSVRGPHGFTFEHYAALLGTEPLAGLGSAPWHAAATSAQVSLVTGVLATALGLGAALVVAHRTRAVWLQVALLAPLGASSVVVGLGSLIVLSRPLFGDFSLAREGLLVPIAHVVVATPLAFAALLPALRGVDPRLYAAAASLGASPLRTTLTVTWPLIRRSVLMAGGLAAAASLGEFGATAFLVRPGGETLPMLIFRLLGRPGADNVGTAYAACVALAAVTTLVALAADTPASRRRLT